MRSRSAYYEIHVELSSSFLLLSLSSDNKQLSKNFSNALIFSNDNGFKFRDYIFNIYFMPTRIRLRVTRDARTSLEPGERHCSCSREIVPLNIFALVVGRFNEPTCFYIQWMLNSNPTRGREGLSGFTVL